MNPIVSIIMPCYNASDYIRQAIESVQAQTFKAWELLVIDDCSTQILTLGKTIFLHCIHAEMKLI